MYLNVHSYYSLRYGTIAVEELPLLARANGVDALCLTDINNSSAMPTFVKSCKENNVKPIAGIEVRNGNDYKYTCIARNNKGFCELNEFVSEHNINNRKYPEQPPLFNDVFVVFPAGKRCLVDLSENEFIGAKPQDCRRYSYSESMKYNDRLLIMHPVTFRGVDGFELHKNLRAIDNNILLSQLKNEYLAGQNEIMLPYDNLLGGYKDFPSIIKNTEKLLGDCCFDFDFDTVKIKKSFTGSYYDDRLLLEKLSFEGLKNRYGENKEAEQRVRREIDVIDHLGFSSYFLITWDIIRYSMSRGFYHVGRGSGANSIVAYCLEITNVDPLELNLYFERFINHKRSSPPDFDIDYSWKDRDDVFDYIFKKYGKKHTAMLGTMSTFKDRSIYRELAKVYGLPKQEIDELVRYGASAENMDGVVNKVCQLAGKLKNFPNQRSIHAGGVLISEEPICWYTALDFPPKGLPVTQWDMYVAEDLGFEKIDILSQRGIGHIKECVDIVAENRKIRIDVHAVDRFKNDEKIKTMLKDGETIGCFYIESPAMRGLLKKLRCDNYNTLVAASSIIRPGVARSGMMKEYIFRYHNPDKINYIHPVMKKHLEETYGVMVYQEDVLKVCHCFAGLGLADADVLRRAMSGKYRSKKEFQRIVDKFFANCCERKYSESVTKEVWRQIESFAGYSFSKAHSASYAVESLQSLYLKAYFPLEFMTAVINNHGGFYRTWVYVNEARRCGAKIELPCVNNSMFEARIIGETIFIGFVLVKNLELRVVKKICAEREMNGSFNGLEDFVKRIEIGHESLLLLIRINALRFTGVNKAKLLWNSYLLFNKKKTKNSSLLLFDRPLVKYSLPELEQSSLRDTYDEIELLEFPVSLSDFDMLETSFRGDVFVADLLSNVGCSVRMVGVLVAVKYVRTVRKEVMCFTTFIDSFGAFFDAVHFPDAIRRYPLRGNGLYLIKAKIEEEFGCQHLKVEKLAKMPMKPNPTSV